MPPRPSVATQFVVVAHDNPQIVVDPSTSVRVQVFGPPRGSVDTRMPPVPSVARHSVADGQATREIQLPGSTSSLVHWGCGAAGSVVTAM